MLQNQWFYNISKHIVAKTNGFTVYSQQQILLELLVLQHCQTNKMQKRLIAGIITFSVVKTMVLATLFWTTLGNHWL